MADPENVAEQPTPGAGGTEDVVVTDRQLYDHAIAPEPAKSDAPAAADQPLLQPQPQQPPLERARDEAGRFAPGKPAPQQQRQPEDHRVPLSELLNSRERAQKAEAEAQQLRQQWAALQQQAAEMQRQQQQPQTIFDDPQQYIQQHVIGPLRQEMQMQRLQEKDAMSREFAAVQFGENSGQMINQALADLGRIRQTPQGNVIYWQIMNSGHPYGALVKWHQQARAQQAIGPDPEAWFRKRSEQLLNDPRWQAAAIQRAQQRQQQQPRGAANVSLPPSLSSMPASAPRLEEIGDLSDESLYRFATK